MAFVEYDHMIEQFATTAANEPFRNAILPWAFEAGLFRLETETLDCIDYVAIEIRGPIKDQVFGSAIVGKASRSCCDTHALVGYCVALR
jgi:hypothetical protein